MPPVTFVTADDVSTTVDVPVGMTIMQAALSHGILGVVGECGGQLVCATCHVYVDDDRLARIPPVGEIEEELLECTAAPRLGSSRLSCQIVMTDDLAHLVVRVPERQN